MLAIINEPFVGDLTQNTLCSQNKMKYNVKVLLGAQQFLMSLLEKNT